MKVVTIPAEIVARLVAVVGKLVWATGEVTFRVGYAVGSLPVKGTAAATRALGPKAVLLFVAGVLVGVFVTRKLVNGPGGPALPSIVPDPPDEVAVDV